MARTFEQDGKILDYTNAGAAIAAGAVVPMGDCVGIALADIAATTGVGPVAVEGCFTVPKVAGTAWVMGDKLDYDLSELKFAKGLTTAAGDIEDCAIAAEAAASGATSALVKLANPGILDPS